MHYLSWFRVGTELRSNWIRILETVTIRTESWTWCCERWRFTRLLLYLQQRRFDVWEETARRVKLHSSITEAVAGTCKDTMLLRSCYSNIQQAALLFKFTFWTSSHRAWENVLLKTYDKYGWELKSLRRMDGHHCNAWRFLAVIAIKITKKRHLLQVIYKHQVVITFFMTALDEVL